MIKLEIKLKIVSFLYNKIIIFLNNEYFNKKILRLWWNSIDENWQEIFIRELNLNSVPNTSELQKIINLKTLNFTSNEIKSLEPLRVFQALENLNINGCGNLENIDGILHNRDLITLEMYSTSVKRIQVLKNFKKLEELHLPIGITSLNCLRSLINLKKLYFGKSNHINSLRSLKKLVNLEEIVVSYTIKSLDDIDNLNKLKRIVCFGVSEIEAYKFKLSHPNTEIVWGEDAKLKSELLIQRVRNVAIRIRKEGFNDEEKSIWGQGK